MLLAALPMGLGRRGRFESPLLRIQQPNQLCMLGQAAGDKHGVVLTNA